MNEPTGVSTAHTHAGRDPLLISVLRVAETLESRLEEALGEAGLSMAKFGLIDLLVKAGKPLTLGELAALSSCVRSNMTQLVDRLEAEGLVVRVDDPADRRIVRAAITPLGEERHAAGAIAFERVQSEFVSALPPAERVVLEQLLSRIQ
jgi:MarR family 2-MHQ and catechol resistance regulon transcriptional repressor